MKRKIKNRKRIARALAVLLLFCMITTGGSAEGGRSVYDIITDLVYAFRMNGVSAYGEVQGYLTELEAEDAPLAKAWRRVMDCWEYVNTDLNTDHDLLPDGLPEDNSLCLVVLGYRLNNDGSMAEELTGRLEAALKNAQKYPNAYIAVTGGGTALMNRTATEADKMAQWLIANGVDQERIIVENQSQTTAENARYTNDILKASYPQVRYAAVITSDYHLSLGMLLFTEAFQLAAYKNSSEAIEVTAGAAYKAASGMAETLMMQGRDVWQMAEVLRIFD